MPKYWHLFRPLAILGLLSSCFGGAAQAERPRTALRLDEPSVAQRLASEQLQPMIVYVPVANEQYTVRFGDTLWSISRKFGVSYPQLKAINGLKGENPVIAEGQQLILPSTQAAPRASRAKVAGSNQFHTVNPDETLTQISKHYGVSVQSIQDANGLANPDALKRGMRLRIPGSTTRSQPSASRVAAPIAPAPGVPVPAWPQRPAQDLAPVHPSAQGMSYYLARQGDTSESIAKSRGITKMELLRINRINDLNYQPTPGDQLFLPPLASAKSSTAKGKRKSIPQQPAASPRPRPAAIPPPMAPAQYAPALMIVKIAPGDSLEGLALRHSTTVEQIKLDNRGIRSNTDLRVGEELRVRGIFR